MSFGKGSREGNVATSETAQGPRTLPENVHVTLVRLAINRAGLDLLFMLGLVTLEDASSVTNSKPVNHTPLLS